MRRGTGAGGRRAAPRCAKRCLRVRAGQQRWGLLLNVCRGARRVVCSGGGMCVAVEYPPATGRRRAWRHRPSDPYGGAASSRAAAARAGPRVSRLATVAATLACPLTADRVSPVPPFAWRPARAPPEWKAAPGMGSVACARLGKQARARTTGEQWIAVMARSTHVSSLAERGGGPFWTSAVPCAHSGDAAQRRYGTMRTETSTPPGCRGHRSRRARRERWGSTRLRVRTWQGGAQREITASERRGHTLSVTATR